MKMMESLMGVKDVQAQNCNNVDWRCYTKCQIDGRGEWYCCIKCEVEW